MNFKFDLDVILIGNIYDIYIIINFFNINFLKNTKILLMLIKFFFFMLNYNFN